MGDAGRWLVLLYPVPAKPEASLEAYIWFVSFQPFWSFPFCLEITTAAITKLSGYGSAHEMTPQCRVLVMSGTGPRRGPTPSSPPTRHSYVGEAVHVSSDHRGGTACVQGDRNTLFPLDPSHHSITGSPAHGLFLSPAFLPGEFSSGVASSARLLHPREVMCFLGDALLTHPDWLYISFPCEAFAPIPTNLTSHFFPAPLYQWAQGFLFDFRLVALITSQMSLVLSHCVVQAWLSPQLWLEIEESCQNTEHWTRTCWLE